LTWPDAVGVGVGLGVDVVDGVGFGEGLRDAVLHLHLRQIHVGADLEGDGETHRAIRC